MPDFSADLIEISRAFSANLQNGGLDAVQNMVYDLAVELRAVGEVADTLATADVSDEGPTLDDISGNFGHDALRARKRYEFAHFLLTRHVVP